MLTVPPAINDCSTDDTHNHFKDLTQNSTHNIMYLNNTIRYGQAFNRYRAYNMCEDDDICILLDGDDWLKSKYVLTYLNKFMMMHDVDMTYGMFEVYLNNTLTPFAKPGDFPKGVIENCNFRSDSWRSCHLRTMKASLLKQIRPLDFLDDNNAFILCSTDMVESFACLELSNGRHKFNREIMMVYNKENSMIYESTSYYTDDNAVYKSRIQQNIRNLPKYKAQIQQKSIIVMRVDDPLFATNVDKYRKTLADTCDLFLYCNYELPNYINILNKYNEIVYI